MKYLINLSLLKKNRNYRLLYLGQFVSFFGTMVTGVALPYQVYQLTHSTLMVGLVSLVQLLPLLFTALIGGVFADRYHRRQLLLISEILLSLGCLLLAFNSHIVPQIWVIFVVASMMSAITGLHRPAYDSITQQLVNKEDFAEVGSLCMFKFSLGMIMGPAIGGLIIASWGITITYLIDFMTFFFSVCTLLLMTHLPGPSNSAVHESTWKSLKSGFNYATSRQELMGTYFVDFIAMIFGLPTALFPAIAAAYGGAKTLGLLYSAPAIGGLIISFCSGWIKNIKRHGLAIAISAAFWGVSIIIFGLASNFWVSIIFLAAAGAGDAVSGMFRGIMWNEIVPTEYRGRLAGIEMISYLSGPRLGDAEAGLVAASFGITESIVSGGILCIVGVGIACYYMPKFLGYKSLPENNAIAAT